MCPMKLLYHDPGPFNIYIEAWSPKMQEMPSCDNSILPVSTDQYTNCIFVRHVVLNCFPTVFTCLHLVFPCVFLWRKVLIQQKTASDLLCQVLVQEQQPIFLWLPCVSLKQAIFSWFFSCRGRGVYQHCRCEICPWGVVTFNWSVGSKYVLYYIQHIYCYCIHMISQDYHVE